MLVLQSPQKNMCRLQDMLLIENCVLQMLVYEFMPNGTLRDHLSGE
jgi:hypothetical protein